MIRVFSDYHHTSLLRSLTLLFEDRLGMCLYRPIGMDWFDEGYWAINNQRDTAQQFLQPEGPANTDGSPLLNQLSRDRNVILNEDPAHGVHIVKDPGGFSTHRACTLEYFKNNRFDYVIASIPAHVPVFERLIAQFQPHAKLIVQVGNNWDLEMFSGRNILASISPRLTTANAIFYHQEFDTEIFHESPTLPVSRIYTFLNCIREYPAAWADFQDLRRMLGSSWEVKSFGGQCPDGNMEGPVELANKMRESMAVLHVKPGGDGFGHIIHNAYAVGRPVITRPSHFRNQLAEQLLIPGTFIDLDRYGRNEVRRILLQLQQDPDGLREMGHRAAARFREVVNYELEGKEIEQWLSGL
jgi:hypothetical protein